MRSTLTPEVTERIKVLYQQGHSAGTVTKIIVGEGQNIKHHQVRYVVNRSGLTRTQADAAQRRVKRLGRWFEKNRKKNCAYCHTEFEPGTVTQTYCHKCNRNGVLSTYGITAEDYDTLLTKQHNKCAVCDCDLQALSSKQIHLDHDHMNGIIRGIVCQTCNWRLGAVDDSGWLQKALTYLANEGLKPKIVGTIMRKKTS